MDLYITDLPQNSERPAVQGGRSRKEDAVNTYYSNQNEPVAATHAFFREDRHKSAGRPDLADQAFKS